MEFKFSGSSAHAILLSGGKLLWVDGTESPKGVQLGPLLKAEGITFKQGKLDLHSVYGRFASSSYPIECYV